MKLIVILVFSVAVFAQQGPGPGGDRGGMSFIRMSPILNAVDVNQDGVLSAAEIASAPARLRTLDKNGDGILTQDEAGIQMGFGRGGGRGRGEGGGRGEEGGGDEPPAPAPTAEELTATLMMFDANHNGQLEKSEVPERMQGLFERGDTNHDGILTRDEIARLAEANRQQANGGGPGGRGGPGGPGGGRGFGGEGRGPGGPNGFDLAFNALDLDHNGQISADEINKAAQSLKTLDKNGDGQITEDEVTPNMGGRGGFREGPGEGR
jgi:Ca2+-binding EF-hand superfamily protein